MHLTSTCPYLPHDNAEYTQHYTNTEPTPDQIRNLTTNCNANDYHGKKGHQRCESKSIVFLSLLLGFFALRGILMDSGHHLRLRSTKHLEQTSKPYIADLPHLHFIRGISRLPQMLRLIFPSAIYLTTPLFPAEPPCPHLAVKLIHHSSLRRFSAVFCVNKKAQPPTPAAGCEPFGIVGPGVSRPR